MVSLILWTRTYVNFIKEKSKKSILRSFLMPFFPCTVFLFPLYSICFCSLCLSLFFLHSFFSLMFFLQSIIFISLFISLFPFTLSILFPNVFLCFSIHTIRLHIFMYFFVLPSLYPSFLYAFLCFNFTLSIVISYVFLCFYLHCIRLHLCIPLF